jgi:hypothetical protein
LGKWEKGTDGGGLYRVTLGDADEVGDLVARPLQFATHPVKAFAFAMMEFVALGFFCPFLCGFH